MFDSLNLILTLAQESAPAPQAEVSPFGPMMIYLAGGLVIFMLVNTIVGRPEARERARREKMIESLKKNDPVVTIGGILGSVVSISEDKQEVTIKVDDNTRLKVQAAAIREVPVREAKE